MNINSKHTTWKFYLLHSQQRDCKASDMDGETQLQFHCMENRLQESPTIDSWQKWHLGSATKLSQLRVVWDVFKKLQIVDANVDLQNMFEALRTSWEQPQQSPKRRFNVKIRTAHGSYLIEMEVRI